MTRVRCGVFLALTITGATAMHAQSLTVAPGLLVFSVYVGHGNAAQQSLSITGASYQVTSQQAAWLSVTPRSGAAPASLSVKADATGLRPGKYQDKISVTSGAHTDTVRVVLVVTQPPPGPVQFAIYEVEVSMTGYVGLVNGAPDCKVRTNGYDRLTGIVSGFETTGNDDDVVYTGTLQRDTDIDYCETKKAPTVDQRAWCAISLKGDAVMDVEITVNFDSLAGAWMKAQPAGPMTRKITKTDCDAQETNDALTGYPTASDGGAGSPNGQQLDDVKAVGANGQPQTFSSSGVTRLRVGTYPPDNPDGWTLRVIRKLP